MANACPHCGHPNSYCPHCGEMTLKKVHAIHLADIKWAGSAEFLYLLLALMLLAAGIGPALIFVIFMANVPLCMNCRKRAWGRRATL